MGIRVAITNYFILQDKLKQFNMYHKIDSRKKGKNIQTMKNTKEKIALILRKKSVWVMFLCGVVFVAAIAGLFMREKHRLDRENSGDCSDY